MDLVRLGDVRQSTSNVIHISWAMGTILFELLREDDELSSSIHELSDAAADVRHLLTGLHDVLRSLARQQPNEEEYEHIFRVTYGIVEDCGEFQQSVIDMLMKIRRSHNEELDGVEEHMRDFNLQLHAPDLPRSGKRMAGHKLTLGITLNMLVL